VSSSRRRELACAARFVFEVGYLKRLPRFGATYAGVGGDETVAAHSFRTAVIAGVLAAAEGLDVARASLMALVHDLPETRTGDLNLVQKRYLQRSVPPGEIVAAQTDGLPAAFAVEVAAVVGEYLERRTPLARLVHDADLLEGIARARELAASRPELMDAWARNLARDLTLATSRDLYDQLMTHSPDDWWVTLARGG